ncbi:hypothetical protein RND71_013921 [Anisodus tanguticus]|uniref:F-box/LRR-repeat protein 17 n=1 Tax=Anisodus tanguticus TaxID=243964 RepID=A0AAE1VJH5_9SOLA|nr:hypothetical protein RND71_013921 [Anisodus tanguticus]
MEGCHSHPSTPISDEFVHKRGKKCGSYNCSRCGIPKKGHICNLSNNPTEEVPTPTTTDAKSFVSSSPRQLRRALSFDDIGVSDESPGSDDEEDSELDLGGCVKVGEMFLEGFGSQLRSSDLVPLKAQIGLVGSVLQKCPGLVKLSLRMKCDVDATILACIAFSCPNLDSVEILTSDTSVNRITGDELGRFVADKRCLTNLKMEGCSNLGGFTLSSTSLSTLCLLDLFCHSKMVFNCPNLKEISLDFSCQENDSTNLAAMVGGIGRICPRLQNIHVASVRLTHAVVLALTAANLRGLRRLSLVQGSEITDASVAAISSSYSRLELIDLSGSSISDSGIGMICNVFPETLSKLLVALCPNITSSGIQFAAAQLPNLELMDCGMSICNPDLDSPTTQENDHVELQRTRSSKLHLIYQKLIIKHSRLKKLSLWGCSGLDALYLNCPELNDLNLNSCMNLNPERLLLQCPNLESVHASGCQDALVETLQNQLGQVRLLCKFHRLEASVCGDFMAGDNHFPCKRLPDGSKRIRVPHLYSPQPFDDAKRKRRISKQRCAVLVY